MLGLYRLQLHVLGIVCADSEAIRTTGRFASAVSCPRCGGKVYRLMVKDLS